jgi:uncharacterized membrane protein YfcA
VGLTGLGGGVLLLPILIFFLRVPATIALGSGSVILVLLLLFVPSAPATPVGTDVIHAFALTGFTGLLRLRLGTVDPDLVFPLLIGSVPGSLVGPTRHGVAELWGEASPWHRLVCHRSKDAVGLGGTAFPNG